MTSGSTDMYGDSHWDDDSDDDTDVFIVSASGRTARKYSGSYIDAQDVIEWVEINGGTGEMLVDDRSEQVVLRVTNAGGGAVVDLDPDDYLVLDKGVFFTEGQYTYEPNPNDGPWDEEIDLWA